MPPSIFERARGESNTDRHEISICSFSFKDDAADEEGAVLSAVVTAWYIPRVS